MSGKGILKFKMVRFFIVGVGTAAFSFTVLYILTDMLHVWYLLSTTIAVFAGFFLGFTLQKLWTFKDARINVAGEQMFSYFLTTLFLLVFNASFMYIFVSVLGIWYLLSQVFSSGILALFTFFIYGFIFEGAQKKSVLVATGLYPPDIGGPATYAKLLEKELPLKGVTIDVVSFGSVRRFPKIVRHALYFLYLAAQSVDAGIVYALDPVSVGLPALLISKLFRKKFILRLVGDYAWEQFQLNRESGIRNKEFLTLEEFQKQKFDWLTEARRSIEQYVARKADVVVVPSEYLRKIVLGWGVEVKKVQIIYNSFGAVEISLNKEMARSELSLDGIVLFSAGRLVPWKGFEALIEVVAELKNKFPDIHLYIAGDGNDEKKLKNRSRELEAPVTFLGALSRGVLLKYIKASDLFVLNTGYEGLSHQILEVMALQTPIITTNVPGNLEIVENLKNGLLVPYNDKEAMKHAIELLIQDKELRERLIRGGNEKIKLFLKEKMIASLVALLSK